MDKAVVVNIHFWVFTRAEGWSSEHQEWEERVGGERSRCGQVGGCSWLQTPLLT